MSVRWLLSPELDRMEALAAICRLLAKVNPLVLVVVGYPDGPLPPPAMRYQPERIHHNFWPPPGPLPQPRNSS